MTPEQADRLGRLADKLDAVLHSSKLPLPPHIHLEGMTGAIRTTRDEVAALYREVTGEDPWETNPLRG